MAELAGRRFKKGKLPEGLRHAFVQDSKKNLNCFKRLAEQEERTLPVRLEAAKARLARQLERERTLQEKYKQKTLLRDDLTVKLAVLQKLQASA